MQIQTPVGDGLKIKIFINRHQLIFDRVLIRLTFQESHVRNCFRNKQPRATASTKLFTLAGNMCQTC